MRVKGTLDDLMDEDDWAVIIGPEGTPKGVFIPKNADENDCPAYIIKMLENVGINFFDDLPQPTLH